MYVAYEFAVVPNAARTRVADLDERERRDVGMGCREKAGVIWSYDRKWEEREGDGGMERDGGSVDVKTILR